MSRRRILRNPKIQVRRRSDRSRSIRIWLDVVWLIGCLLSSIACCDEAKVKEKKEKEKEKVPKPPASPKKSSVEPDVGAQGFLRCSN